MASSQPIINQIRIISFTTQILLMGMATFIYYLIGIKDPTLYGFLTYLIILIIVRQAIPMNHRKGIRLYRRCQYEKSILEFQKSYDFFEKHKWIDKYRYVFVLSISRISYLEMSLINMAYCYSQIGQGVKSKEMYEKTLLEFPNSQIAISALKIFESAKNI